jgi:hypothetical protein
MSSPDPVEKAIKQFAELVDRFIDVHGKPR